MRRIVPTIKRLLLNLLVAVLGFVVGAFALYVVSIRGGPPLQLWHTEKLTAEFTQEKAGAIQGFDGYKRLEDELFAQLDKEIYANTQAGRRKMFARYSAGSASDPRRLNPDWNRSFELPAAAPAGGVLLLHGMSDSPYSLRALGETLNRHDYWVVGLRLPGHGTIPSGLKYITWEDMAAAVRLAMQHLESKVGAKRIHIVGYSTGAPLALDYALETLDETGLPAPGSLVLVSPAIGITAAAAVAKWKGKLAVVPGLEKLAWTSILPEFDPYKYNSFATNAGDQVHRLTRRVAAAVEAKAAAGPIADFPPTLVFLSTVDATVSTDAVIDNLLEHLAPEGHELVLFDINRTDSASTVLVSDPGPLTARLLASAGLPFRLNLITNQDTETRNIVSQHKEALSTRATTEPLGLSWPSNMLSLSHIALPFAPDDPVYGQGPATDPDRVFLGQMSLQGERGLLLFSADWLLRLRYNPFYDVLETRTLQWLDNAGDH